VDGHWGGEGTPRRGTRRKLPFRSGRFLSVGGPRPSPEGGSPLREGRPLPKDRVSKEDPYSLGSQGERKAPARPLGSNDCCPRPIGSFLSSTHRGGGSPKQGSRPRYGPRTNLGGTLERGDIKPADRPRAMALRGPASPRALDPFPEVPSSVPKAQSPDRKKTPVVSEKRPPAPGGSRRRQETGAFRDGSRPTSDSGDAGKVKARRSGRLRRYPGPPA
jgi:hypothetical protein